MPYRFRELPGLPGVFTLLLLPPFVFRSELDLLMFPQLLKDFDALIGLNQLLPDLGDPFAENLPDLIDPSGFHGELPRVIPATGSLIDIELRGLLQREHLRQDRGPFIEKALPLGDQFLIFGE